MVNVGIAGIGFMGWIHWLAYQQVATARVTAICSHDEKKRAGDWTGIKGNFGPPGETVDLTGIRVYASLEEMIADPDLHVIDLCLPPFKHTEAAIQALQFGKHVICEKPMALTVSDCDRMITAAHENQRQLLIGHVLPFFPEYHVVRETVDSRDYGRLLGGHFKRVISDPVWLNDFYDPARVGGPLIDLHVHDAHFIRLLFGLPQAVTSVGRCRGKVVEYCQTSFEFPEKQLVVSATSGVIGQQGRPFMHGFEIHFEQATMQFEFAGFSDRAEQMPLKIFRRRWIGYSAGIGGWGPCIRICCRVD